MENKTQILLVEDDQGLAEITQEYLESKDLTVTIVGDGLEAVDAIIDGQPDLVILDLMLPGLDGISVCKKVRDKYKGPILMLTASADPFDQVVGLEMGADDFVQKPVEPRILLARIRARLRNTEQSTVAENQTVPQDLTFTDLTIKAASRQVLVGQHQVDLTGPEYDVLLCLVENTGQIQDRDALFRAIRGIDYDGKSRMIDIIISQVRHKLNQFNYANQHIKTVRNRGYLFVPEL
ncbi:MAG: response regulator transcription factor [Bermanella sp.]